MTKCKNADSTVQPDHAKTTTSRRALNLPFILSLTVVGLLLFGFAVSLSAQSATGEINGTVKDASGAVIHGATVDLVNEGTGLARHEKTNDAGIYNFPLIPVGTYTVTAAADGFKTARQTGIKVNVGDVVQTDMPLAVGAANETVEIQATAAGLQTENAEIAETVTTQQVNDLPLYGRSFTDLLTLEPTTVLFNAYVDNNRAGEGGADYSAGARKESQYFMLDGTTITDSAFSTPAVSISLDAIQEFKLQTGNYSAEYGGGTNQVNIISKSGTNDLHGDVFWFNRNNDYDARCYFCPPQVPRLDQNQFGFVAGGPVVIPKVYNGRNKTFWMANYEGLRIVGSTVQLGLVPTAAMLQGNFQGLPTIYDPSTITPSNPTGNPFPNNMVPASSFSTLAKQILAASPSIFPAPNGSYAGAHNFRAVIPTPTKANQQTYRLDQSLGKWGDVFVRGTYSNYSSTLSGGLTAWSNSIASEKTANWQVNHTKTFGPNMVNVFRLGYLDATYGQSPQMTLSSSQVSAFGFVNAYEGLPSGDRVYPTLSFGNGFSPVGGPLFSSNGSDQPTWNFSDTLNIAHGKHSIALGFSYLRFSAEDNVAVYVGGIGFGIPGGMSQNPISDFLTGYFANASANIPTEFSTDANPGNPGYFNRRLLAPFVQDDWKITPRLTLNLGVRYDFSSLPFDNNGKESWIDPTNTAGGGICFGDYQLVTAGISSTAPNSYYRYCGATHPGSPNYTPFAPRFGFAWRPFGDKTVVRGGYGIFFDVNDTAEGLGGNLFPFSATAGAVQAKGQANPFITTSSLWPALTFSGPAVPSDNSGSIDIVQTVHPHNPYYQDWSFGIERELGHATMVQVYYRGGRGTHLEQRIPPNQPFAPTAAELATCTGSGINTVCPNVPPPSARLPYPNFPDDGVIADDESGWSTYHAGVVKVEHHTSQLTGSLAYTWAKSLDNKSDVSDIGNEAAGFIQSGQNFRNPRSDYGPSDFNVASRLVGSFVYSLPFGRGKQFANGINKAVDALIGGWQLNGILTLQSGNPFTIYCNEIGNEMQTNYTERCNPVAGQPIYPAHKSILEWFNPAAFTDAPEGTYGTIGRNTVVGPGYADLDSSLFKSFNLGEKLRVQIRVESFNTFNRANFFEPSPYIDYPGAGQISSTLPNSQAQTVGRQLQMGAKFFF